MSKKKYSVKEIFFTLQGEGYHSGRPAVFCRFTGCNLWTGREKDRKNAICNFCDTDFVGTDGENGGVYTAEKLTEKILSLWPEESKREVFVVFTGGEPALQIDHNLLSELKKAKCYLAVETNGTKDLPNGLDWVCVSPKPNTDIRQVTGNEIKIVFDCGVNPGDFAHFDFEHFYISPKDCSDYKEMLQRSIKYCLENPLWKLSLQTHKIMDIP